MKNAARSRALVSSSIPTPSSLTLQLCAVADGSDDDPQVAAAGEGVARIQGEVHEHLLQLGLVDPRDRSALELARDVDVLREQSAQDRLEAADHVGDIHGLEPQDLPAREGEQLPRQLGRPAGGPR